MKKVLIILLVLYFSNGLSFGKECKIEMDSIFSENFKIIEKAFPTQFFNEIENLTLTENLNAFINLVSLLSGKGCENVSHFGVTKITRSEFKKWTDWYKINASKLKACEIIDGYVILKDGVNNYEEERKLIEYNILQYPEPILFKKE